MLENLLSDEQIKQFVGVVQDQCDKYRIRNESIKDLFYDPYCIHRKEHDFTAAILSAFRPDSNVINDFRISALHYGRGHVQPELTNDTVVLHIYNESNPLDSMTIKSKCETHNVDLDTFPIFVCLKFNHTEDYFLKSLKLVVQCYEN